MSHLFAEHRRDTRRTTCRTFLQDCLSETFFVALDSLPRSSEKALPGAGVPQRTKGRVVPRLSLGEPKLQPRPSCVRFEPKCGLARHHSFLARTPKKFFGVLPAHHSPTPPPPNPSLCPRWYTRAR